MTYVPLPRRAPLRRKPVRRTLSRRVLAEPMPEAVYQAVMRRSGGRCEVCGDPARSLHWHHRLTVQHGGPNTVVNGLAVHPACHADRVHSRRARALEAGWLVRRGDDPAAVPVLYHGRRWVLLTEDGRVEDVAA